MYVSALPYNSPSISPTDTDPPAAAQTPGAQGDNFGPTSGGDDFLSREKALLGDDANQFSTSNDNAAFVEDGDDDDLLGGGGGYSGGNEELNEFESSFPAIDSRNEVCTSRVLSLKYIII